VPTHETGIGGRGRSRSSPPPPGPPSRFADRSNGKSACAEATASPFDIDDLRRDHLVAVALLIINRRGEHREVLVHRHFCNSAAAVWALCGAQTVIARPSASVLSNTRAPHGRPSRAIVQRAGLTPARFDRPTWAQAAALSPSDLALSLLTWVYPHRSSRWGMARRCLTSESQP
jgi:hypothetical protein